MSSDRTAEIWATRVKREILALTATIDRDEDDANHEGKDEDKKSPELADADADADEVSSHDTPKHDNLNIATLPLFVKVHSHEMNLDAGLAKVTFAVEVEVPQGAADKSSTAEKEEVDDETMTAPPAGDAEIEAATKTAPSGNKIETVLLTLDASMEMSATHHMVCYPFQKPRVVLTKGSSLFCASSTIKDGDYIDLDCDWTPSLHLSDAILNVALKVRESIKRGDPFAAATVDIAGISAEGTGVAVADRMVNVADEISASVSNFLGSLRRNDNAPSARKPKKASPARRGKALNQVKIGDVINLTIPPFSQCEGMYSVKAIRRPKFVEKAIADAEAKASATADTDSPPASVPEASEASGDAGDGGNSNRFRRGLMGASTFFKSVETKLVQSTKSLVEEYFLLVTDTHLLEVKSSKFNVDQATVTFAAPISLLTKLKFRREESVSLFFKQSSDDPLIYLCPESADAVTQIQSVLKRHGVRGKHTTSATQKQIQKALKLVSLIRTKESSLDNAETDRLSRDASTMMERVNEIMDLYRQAAEHFETAGDIRHTEVVTHMQAFLAKPLTVSILDGSYTAPLSRKSDESAEAKEVEAASPSTEKSYEDTMKTVDDMMKEVENLGMGDGEDDDFLSGISTAETSTETADETGALMGDDHDAIADLDAMLNEADKELQSIMNGEDD
jgi:hypothetical protein